jgi:chromosome segregation ATPase
MDKLDVLEQKVLSAVTKINQIEAEREEIKKQLGARSAEVEALELEKKHLLGEIEGLKGLKEENERLRGSMEAAQKRVEGIISKIEAAGVGEAVEETEVSEVEEEEEPVSVSDTEEPDVDEEAEASGEVDEASESIFESG